MILFDLLTIKKLFLRERAQASENSRLLCQIAKGKFLFSKVKSAFFVVLQNFSFAEKIHRTIKSNAESAGRVRYI